MTISYTNPPGRPSAGELRSRRMRAGLTQRELAGLAECSLASVANMEHGYVPQESEVLARVVRVLETYDDRPGRKPAGAVQRSVTARAEGERRGGGR